MSTAGTSGNQAGIEEAEKLFSHAQAAGEQASQIAERTKDRQLEASAAGTLKRITDTQISAEQTLTDQQKNRAAALGKFQGQQEAIANQLKDQGKVLTDNLGLFDKEGEQYSPEQQRSGPKKHKMRLAKLQALVSTPRICLLPIRSG